MELALEADDKPVNYILIPRENHFLIRPDSRQRVLNELSAFLAANTAPRPKPQQPAD